MWLDQYADFIQAFIHSNRVLAPLLILMLEELGLPTLVPGDAILAYVGSAVQRTGPSVSLITAAVIAIVAVLVGSTILYYASRRWGEFIVKKLGKFIFLKESHIERAKVLFAKYGVLTIIFGRHIPGMRAPVTIFAAVSGIRYRVFITCTFISTVAWAIFWLNVGHRYGKSIQHLVRDHLPISITVIISIVVIFLVIHFVGEAGEKARARLQAKKSTHTD